MLEWLERNRGSIAAVLVVLVTVAGVTVLQLPRRPALQVVSPSGLDGPPPIKVHVVGAVLSPGVYQLPADARLEDALKAAGGPSGSGDTATLNLATPLRDGQQVVVPDRSAPSAVSSSSQRPTASAPASATRAPAAASSGKLDLNAASQRDLEALPGIGPVTAQRIIDYRQKNGRIVAVQELKDAKLVNSSVYERIKDMVEVR